MHFKILFLVCILGLYTHKTNSQYLVSRASVSLPFDVNKSLHTTVSAHSQLSGRTRNRRMYAMCPPSFQRVGTDCYSLVEQRSSWLEAHFFCKDKNAKLAEPVKYSDRKLRVFLAQHDIQTGDRDPIWIGATFDHHNNVWQYSISGRNLSYANFERIDLNQPMDNQCAVYDPNNKYRWSSRSCPDKFRFICQHKMPKVSERNRHKVYHRWNATYPNQYANEVVLKVIDNNNGKNDRRNHRRVIAEGSNEEILIPKVRLQNARRRQHLHQRQNNAQSNEVNYDVVQKRQKHIPKSSTSTTTTAPHHDIKPSLSDNQKPQTDRQLTSYDRKLQRQREKEQRRQQRKRERQERMREEKRERIRQHRQHQQTLHQQQKQDKHEPAPLHKSQSQQEQEQESRIENNDQPHVIEEHPPLQIVQAMDKENNELNRNQERNAHENERPVDQLKQRFIEANRKRAEEERLQKQHEAEIREAEDRLHEQESKAKEERLQKDHENHLKELEKEQERQLQAEKDFKHRQEEELRKQFEEQEKQRQEEIKRNQEEEEKLKELQRLEEVRIFEQQELDRMREENQKREEAQRKREEEIARREAEQRQIEYEEERIRKELEQAEIDRNLKHEEEIKREEEALKAREESEKREREEKERLREERFNVLKQQADQQVKKEMEEKRRNYAERISKLSPEDQKAFIELRKRRKQLRVKQQSERLKRAHAEINAEAMKESSINGVAVQ